MKIKTIKIKNLGAVQNIAIEFGDKITRLVGVNGSGKSSVINAVWIAFKGIARGGFPHFIADRFRMIGTDGKSADVELTLLDDDKNAEIKIKRHITKDTNKISFEAPEGYAINESWLTNLLDVSLMSATQFVTLSGQQQALTLGVNTYKYEEEITSLKEEAKLIRRDIKNFGELVKVAKIEKVDVGKLVNKRDKILEFNKTQEDKREEAKSANLLLAKHEGSKKEIEAEIKRLQADLKEVEERIVKGTIYISELPKIEPDKATDEVDLEISQISETNKMAQDYETYIEKKESKDAEEKKLAENVEAQRKVEASKAKYISNHDFGIDGISIDETGCLLCDGKKIKPPYFSTGELEMIVAKLAASMNPDLKVRFIDGFEALDEGNQETLIKGLNDAGFQAIVAEVGNERKSGNTILLKDCTVLPEAVMKYK